LENTWIVFTSDHGEMLGDHHLGAKVIYCDGSARVPLLVCPPVGHTSKAGRAGTVDDRLVCLADLMPTLLDLAGTTSPPVDGFNLLGDGRRERLIGECLDCHAVIERDWKYQFSEVGGDELLFHLADDPMEQRNLIATVPDQAARLRGILNQSLCERDHRAAGEDRPQATRERMEIRQQRAAAFPGFHHRTFRDSDVVH